MKQSIKDRIEQSITVKQGLFEQLELIEKIINEIIKGYQNNKKILICGNGGSAADSQHFAAELMGRFKKERKALPAIALTTDTSTLTAIANDYGFEKVFSRQVEALGNNGDMLIGISTSGNSRNIIEAVKEAKTKGMKTICLLGCDGGLLKNICDASIIIKNKDIPRIQEGHIMLIHIICEMIEQELFNKNGY